MHFQPLLHLYIADAANYDNAGCVVDVAEAASLSEDDFPHSSATDDVDVGPRPALDGTGSEEDGDDSGGSGGGGSGGGDDGGGDDIAEDITRRTAGGWVKVPE